MDAGMFVIWSFATIGIWEAARLAIGGDMRRNEVTIDINRLDLRSLRRVRSILYRQGDWASAGYHDAMRRVQEREAFLAGWMSPEDERRYIERHC